MIDHTTVPDFHVVFILHGYGGSPNDMNKVLDLLSFMYPLVKCVLIHKCYSNETKSLQYLANNVVEEIVTQLKQIQEDEKRPLGRISFIAHSIGGLVFRIAMNDPRLDPYKQYYHLFLSLNVPHLGISFGNYKTDIGASYLRVSAIIFSISYILGPLSSILQTINKSKTIFISNLIGCIIKNITLFLLLYLKLDMYPLLISYFLSYLYIVLHQYKIFKKVRQ